MYIYTYRERERIHNINYNNDNNNDAPTPKIRPADRHRRPSIALDGVREARRKRTKCLSHLNPDIP